MKLTKDGHLLLEGEDDSKCELCGDISECRPYGPNGENICYPCGMKNEAATAKACAKRIKTLFDLRDAKGDN